MYKNNAAAIARALDKQKNNELSVEDILDEEDLVNDLKSPSYSQLYSFLNSERIIKLLDYTLKEPNVSTEDEQKFGHKFPYFACEILCSDNTNILDKYFDDNKQEESKEDDADISQDEQTHSQASPNKHNPNEKIWDDETDNSDKINKETDKENQTKTNADKDNSEVKEVQKSENTTVTTSTTTEIVTVSTDKSDEEFENVTNSISNLEIKDSNICEVLDSQGERKRTVSISLTQDVLSTI